MNKIENQVDHHKHTPKHLRRQDETWRSMVGKNIGMTDTNELCK